MGAHHPTLRKIPVEVSGLLKMMIITRAILTTNNNIFTAKIK